MHLISHSFFAVVEMNILRLQFRHSRPQYQKRKSQQLNRLFSFTDGISFQKQFRKHMLYLFERGRTENELNGSGYDIVCVLLWVR